jgi:hypothetical protein
MPAVATDQCGGVDREGLARPTRRMHKIVFRLGSFLQIIWAGERHPWKDGSRGKPNAF